MCQCIFNPASELESWVNGHTRASGSETPQHLIANLSQESAVVVAHGAYPHCIGMEWSLLKQLCVEPMLLTLGPGLKTCHSSDVLPRKIQQSSNRSVHF